MKNKIALIAIVGLTLAASALTGCVSAINTKDVTKITQTTTGLKICQSAVDKTPQLIFGREQVEYLKIPTGLAGGSGTNSPATPVSDTPTVVSSYELNGSSAVFGRARMTTTFAVGKDAVATDLGGQHQPINEGTGTNQVETVPGALTNKSTDFLAIPAGTSLAAPNP